MASGATAHAALSELSAQGALFYSDCMSDARPSGVRVVSDRLAGPWTGLALELTQTIARFHAQTLLDAHFALLAAHRVSWWCCSSSGSPTRWRA